MESLAKKYQILQNNWAKIKIIMKFHQFLEKNSIFFWQNSCFLKKGIISL